MANSDKRILAAGTVTLRDNDGLTEVLLVHRPRYDDWSLPKGKLESAELLPVCATRETAEETSVTTRLTTPVGEIVYPISSGTKLVSYWVGRTVRERRHSPNHEVDELGWFSITSALRRASYSDEREVIRRAVNLPATTPLVLLRHAKAISRSDWDGDTDHDRGLDERGRQQSKELVNLLDAYGVQRVVTSSAVRCARTVRPFAKARQVTVEEEPALTEEAGVPDPRGVGRLMRKLAARTAKTGVPTVVCGHRPVFPAMFDGLGIEPRSLTPAAALVAHLDTGGGIVALELHRPLN